MTDRRDKLAMRDDGNPSLPDFPGAIQPIGFLVALTSDWMISRVSTNIDQFVGKSADQLLSRHGNLLFSDDAVHALRNRLALLRSPDALERLFCCALFGDDRLFDVALHMSGGRVILEAVPATEQHHGDVTGTLRGLVARLDQAADLESFLNEGARQMRALTGFNRVVICRLHEDGSNETIAESTRTGIGALAGQVAARAALRPDRADDDGRSLLRVISDNEAEPVPLAAAPGREGQALDLSLSVLRAPSPAQQEALRAAGARAWMSASTFVDGLLWGQFLCALDVPRCPSFERRSVVELFALMFSMRLECRLLRDSLP